MNCSVLFYISPIFKSNLDSIIVSFLHDLIVHVNCNSDVRRSFFVWNKNVLPECGMEGTYFSWQYRFYYYLQVVL